MSFRIILSPAKSLNLSTPTIAYKVDPLYFLKEAKKIHSVLKKLKAHEIQAMMNVSSAIADSFVLNMKQYNQSFHYPAIEMFSGEVYRGLDVKSLSQVDLEWMHINLRILSGMYGLIRPLDCIAPYRLEMKTKIQINDKKNLYEFWHKKIASALSKETDCLINLASTEYSKVVLSYWKNKKVINPIFMEGKGSNMKIVMMYAKNARGKMARFIIQNKIEDLEVLKTFSEDGYQFAADISTENDWYFLR